MTKIKKYLTFARGGLLLCCVALGTAERVNAQELTYRSSPRTMQGMRPLGMGGAFIAADTLDENTLFYNPAALNPINNKEASKKIRMLFLLPTIEFSAKAINFFASDLLDLADDIDGAATNAAKTRVFNNFHQANTGRYEEIGIRGPIAFFQHKWLTASLIYQNHSILALRNPSSAEIDIEAATEGGLAVGSAYSFFDDLVKAGLSLKFVARHLIDELVTTRDVTTANEFQDILDYNNVGFGVGVDIGVKGKIPLKNIKVWDFLDPSFALTFQDLGDRRYSGGVGRTQSSFTTGFALHPEVWKFKTIFAFDIRDLDHKTDFITKMHTGYEITWPEISKILRDASARIGVSQGYIAAGLGVNFHYFKLNFATYGRELGQKTRQKESRMVGVQLAAGF